ncbi:SDR family NAD(P)-dependent oxidoreductase [Streptomyces sp. SPB78]|uniref:SDR family NAD(P)-dependent oxidoreductase n=1 Tax=Streptomyces sp. (strain SPB78) TaxID=591157 RepID=UPI0001B58485|nr:SDR family NAD(P)-dependent oxidoreductase [Streptomyces sp. SPB78]
MSLPTTPFDRDSTADDVLAGVDLHGRTALVTGGSSGVGAATAHALARAGARVVLAARGLGTAREVAARITAGTGNEAVTATPLDLSDPASVRAFVAAWEGPLHMLVNNAGIMALPALGLTPEGWERQFATNHLGHFALATGLRPALAAAGGARVAALSSTGHFASPVVFDDINFAAPPVTTSFHRAYGRARRPPEARLLRRRGRKRWAADGIAAHAVMPGGIKSPLQRHAFGDDMDARARAVYEAYPWRSAEQGAATSVLAVASPLLDGVTGAYLQNCQEAPVLDPARAAEEPEPFGVAAWARDTEAAGRLWELSAAVS